MYAREDLTHPADGSLRGHAEAVSRYFESDRVRETSRLRSSPGITSLPVGVGWTAGAEGGLGGTEEYRTFLRAGLAHRRCPLGAVTVAAAMPIRHSQVHQPYRSRIWRWEGQRLPSSTTAVATTGNKSP